MVWRLVIAFLLLSAGAQAARVTSPQEFACANGLIVSGVVLEVDRLEPYQGTPGADGMVPEYSRCRARIMVHNVLKSRDLAIAAGETILVSYPCGMILQGATSLVSVDANGDSLFVATGASPIGGGGYRLASGDSILLGLALTAGVLEAGPGGFTWPVNDAAEISRLASGGCEPSN